MTDDEMRIAIAEECGWKRVDLRKNYHAWVKDGSTDLPDFPNDLNAMADAEQVLTDEQQKVYIHHLTRAPMDNLWDFAWDSCFACVSSTARQRAEAFLKTIGRWEDK